jgi:hypothetical protein
MKATTGFTMVVVAGAFWACFGPVTPATAYPPDPDNAAVLYYQSFLLYNAPTSESFDDFVKGKTGPSEEVKQCLQTGRTAISYALLAAEREHCDWGLVYSKGFSLALPHLAQCRSLSKLLLADARLLASEGNYRKALERCLSTKKLARHVSDEVVISLLVRHAIDALADDCIRDILGMTPPDLQTLEWLKGQLAAVSAPQASFAKGLKYEQEMALEMMQMDRLPELKEALTGGDTSQMPTKIDEEFLAKNRAYYTRCMTTMQATLAGPMSYREKWSALQAMLNPLPQEAGKGTDAVLTASLVPALGKVYSIEVKAQARANALRVGLGLLTAKAQTGSLPERLPANMLKDSFSGQDYLYQKTAAGFMLRCQGKDLDKDQVYEWEFKVK